MGRLVGDISLHAANSNQRHSRHLQFQRAEDTLVVKVAAPALSALIFPSSTMTSAGTAEAVVLTNSPPERQPPPARP